MDLGLHGKSALVTASSGGIGQAIAGQLAGEGAIVYVNGRKQEEVAAAIVALKRERPSADLRGIVADAGSPEGAQRIFDAIPALDILVNNLGVYNDRPFFQASDADWQRAFELNVLSGVRLARHYLAGMLDKGSGRVVFIASEAAFVPAPELPYYSATKTMLLSVSRTLAELTRASRVTVNAVVPGSARTDGSRAFVQGLYPDLPYPEAETRFMRERRRDSIIERLIEPGEIAATVAFVCSGLAGAINGTAVRVDGGLVRTVF